MQFGIQKRWFIPLVMFISAFSVPLLFHAAGLPLPFRGDGNSLGRLILFILSMLGLAMAIGKALSLVLLKYLPQR